MGQGAELISLRSVVGILVLCTLIDLSTFLDTHMTQPERKYVCNQETWEEMASFNRKNGLIKYSFNQ